MSRRRWQVFYPTITHLNSDKFLEDGVMKELIVKSPAFENNKFIPSKYTCDGENVNPPLTIDGIPERTKSLALIIEDPDAPAGLWVCRRWLGAGSRFRHRM